MPDGPKVCRQTYLGLEPKRVDRKYTLSLAEIRDCELPTAMTIYTC